VSAALLLAVAALCTNPADSDRWDDRLTPKEVLHCQKYYINCYKASAGKGMKYEELILADCVLEKKELGGSK
jgi:hypothetical protein